MLHSHMLGKQSGFYVLFLAVWAFHRCLLTGRKVALQHMKSKLAFAFERAPYADALVEMLQKRGSSIIADLLTMIALLPYTFFADDDGTALVLERLQGNSIAVLALEGGRDVYSTHILSLHCLRFIIKKGKPLFTSKCAANMLELSDIALRSLYYFQMNRNKQQQLADTQFFSKASEQIRRICQQSINEQAVARKIKKINALKDDRTIKTASPDIYLKHIVLDFLRSHNLNYSYSVLMKECDILTAQVVSRQELVKTFSLETYYSSSALNTSVIQLVLDKLAAIDQQKITTQYGVQVELLKSDSSPNGVLLKQVQVASIRKEVQERQKKHYEAMLANMKKQLTVMLKQDLKKQYNLKMKETRAQYERQVNALKQKNKEFLINNPKINPKVEEYVKQIVELTNSNATLSASIGELQKEKISHNCFKVPKIVAKQQQLSDIRSQLLAKKQEYQFALKTLSTSVNNLAYQNQKVNAAEKDTDLFLEHMKNKKNTKQFMIDEIYRRMMVMDRRVASLSKDNEVLRENNRLLSLKVTEYQAFNAQLKQKAELTHKAQEKLKLASFKPQTKNVGIDVNAELMAQPSKKQNAIDASYSQQSSSEQDSAVDRKAAMRLQVNTLYSQLQIQRNKLRYFVEDFQ